MANKTKNVFVMFMDVKLLAFKFSMKKVYNHGTWVNIQPKIKAFCPTRWQHKHVWRVTKTNTQ